MKNVTAVIGLFISIAISNNLFAQKMTPGKSDIHSSVFTIDLSTPTINSVSSQTDRRSLQANTKEPITFQLINGNPFKYKYVINTNMVSFFTSGVNPLDSALNASRNRATAKNLNAVSLKTDAAADSANKESNSLKQNIKVLSKQVSAITQSNNPPRDSKARVKTIEAAIGLDQAKLNLLNKAIRARNGTRITSLSETLKANILENINYSVEKKQLAIESPGIDTSKADLLKTLKKSALLVNQKSIAVDNDVKDFNSDLISEDYINKEKFVSTRNKLKRDYFGIINSLNHLDEVAQQVDTTDAVYAKIYAGITTNVENIQTQLRQFFGIQLDNYILPIDANGKNIDLLKITVERHESKTAALIDKYDYNIWINGGLKLDVSGGAFITSLVDNKYFTADSGTVAGQSRKYIYKSNIGKYQIGFGSMLNISYRTGSAWWSPSLSVGALFSNEQKFQILTGLGLVLGKEQRIVLHYGLSMGNVTHIENSYIADTRIAYSLGSNNQVPAQEKFDFGHFFGITYNFGGAKVKAPGTKE